MGNEKKSVFSQQGRISAAISGGTAGAFIAVVLQPLDVLRTRMQADAAAGLLRKTPLGVVRTIAKEGGTVSLWRGCAPTVVRLAAGAGGHFMLLEQFKSLLVQKDEQGREYLSPARAALAGGGSRAVAATILAPITLLKTQMEYGLCSQGSYQSQTMMSTALRVFKLDGIGGFYRGMVPTILTNSSFSALHFTFYSQLRQYSKAHYPEHQGGLMNFGLGAVSALTATTLTQPLDVIRTRSQLGFSKGVIKGITQTIQQGGVMQLMVGVQPRFIKRTLQTAFLWFMYEELAPEISKIGESIKKTWFNSQQAHAT